MLTWVLAAAALAAGVTGAWSPCGFSMVDTLAASAREHGRRVLPPACASFGVGCILGGAATFGGAAGLGALLRLGGGDSVAAAAVLAATAAVAELAGIRIRPQIRRQVPEPWRRSLPLPLAAGLYGVLLGLGFTTFVLTLAVVALVAVSLALGNLELGLIVGAGFGLGRLLPVIALAAAGDRQLGMRILELMAERPAALRAMRAADGIALAGCAVLIGGAGAHAAVRVADRATDPSATGPYLVWEEPGGPSFIHSGRYTFALPGRDAAIGGPFAAWHDGDRVTVLRLRNQQPVFSRAVPGVGELSVSSRWLAYRRSTPGGGTVIDAVRLPGGAAHRVAATRSAGALGRPSLSGDRLVYHVASPAGSAIRLVNLRRHRRSTLLRSRTSQLLNPSLSRRGMAYVVVGRCGQQVVLLHRGRTRVLLRGRAPAAQDPGFDPGHTPQGSMRPCSRPTRTNRLFWTTALTRRWAYVAIIRPSARGAGATLVRIHL